MPAQSGRHDIQAYAGRGGITLNHHKSPFIEQTDMANIQIIQGDFEKKLKLQFAPGIRAGFPSPAEDYNHETLDFNRDLIRNPEATFYGKVEGDSMIEAGINDGDIAVIDGINKVNGTETIVLGSQQYTQKDGKGNANVFANAIKHDYKSKNPTTRWSDIIRLK